MSLCNHTHWSPCSQLASVYGRAAVPKASSTYFDWEPPLAEQAHKVSGMPFSRAYKKRVNTSEKLLGNM